MNAIIIDDEKIGANTLQTLLTKHCGHVNLLAIKHSAPEGIKSILDLKPDLVFLDIEISPDTGFDVIDATNHLNYKVIFTTAYDNYALKAFKIQAIDYLLKPIDTEELIQAVQHAHLRIKENDKRTNEQLETFFKSIKNPAKKISLPTGKGLTLVAPGEIIYLESDSNYTKVFLKTGEKILISKTLKDLAEKFSGTIFCRVHAAYTVNLDEIDQYIKGDGGYLILKNKASIPVSRAYKQELLNKIGL
ncbi:DNA-binding response regulator [Sphingobacteriaceae bacterium]|nr:DNA-binding response regulator [Sphingobacteriaceae bacterium]